MDIHLFSSKPDDCIRIKGIIENCLFIIDSACIHIYYDSEVRLNINKIKALTI